MKTRVIAGFCMVPLLVLVYLGGYWLMATTFIIAILGAKEFYDGFRAMDIHPSYIIGFVSIFLLFGMNLWKGLFASTAYIYIAWMVITVFACLIYCLDINKRKIEDGLATMVGVFYIGLFAYHIVLIDQTPCNILIWLVFITSLGTDSGAYFAGYFFGKKKLCPDLSPKKTWAGAIGGTIVSIVLSGVFALIFCEEYLIHALIIGLICGVVSQLGDLTASAFKRKMGIKDYSNLIPGHGGIMDRFDSVIMVAPFIFYYIIFVIL